MRFKLAMAAGLALAALGTSTSSATPVLPGGPATPPTIDLTVGTLVDSMSLPYTAQNGQHKTLATGTVNEYVISGDLTNPYHGLEFIYQFNNNPSNGGTTFTSASVDAFSGFLTNVGVESAFTTTNPSVVVHTSTGTQAPTSVSRSSDGSTIDFNFFEDPTKTIGGVPPNASTLYLVVDTNATHYDNNGTFTLDDHAIGAVAAFEAVPAPAPASVWGGLGLFGLLGAAALRRRAAKLA